MSGQKIAAVFIFAAAVGLLVLGQVMHSVLITGFAVIPAFLAGLYSFDSCDCDGCDPIERDAETGEILNR